MRPASPASRCVTRSGRPAGGRATAASDPPARSVRAPAGQDSAVGRRTVSTMQAAILCGGKGTRAWPYTAEVPKPLLHVAGQPVLLHVLELYASQGVHEFVLAAGFKHELISEFADSLPGEWKVDVVDTGEETNTGE